MDQAVSGVPPVISLTGAARRRVVKLPFGNAGLAPPPSPQHIDAANVPRSRDGSLSPWCKIASLPCNSHSRPRALPSPVSSEQLQVRVMGVWNQEGV
ncbi:hypothetical protein DPEC_G00149330 [Dallia pectoralis]|uniref:Uncharacterized protein n=1 Tax=Dallia pectoralis TaxID=75939 RepID=A0ACC2GIZ6_DALPE|nr:hypothetical protein DPEC_G00149330 [Dallia pectoralis]